MTQPARTLRSVPADPGTAGPDVDAEEMARAALARARKALPGLDPAVYDCYLGGIVRQIEQTSEADPIGILAQLICAAGVHMGRAPHVRAGDDPHPLLVWPLIVGRTGGGRKGSGWSAAKRLLGAADPGFMQTNVRSGLTSGEGLAAMFTEPDEDSDSVPAGALPAGEKRLLVFEPEWAGVMARMKREGNSLSATLRAAWEGGDLSTLAVNARIARDTHVGIVAHITPEEFRAKVSASDLAGGTYNRFLPIAVAQAQFLPFSQGADPALIDHYGNALAARLNRGAGLGTLGFTSAAAGLWRRLYVELNSDHGDTGPVEQFISRAAPSCLRIAAIHAAVDGADAIDTPHLTAAAALVRYSIASARSVFTDTEALTKLAAWIAAAGETGRTRKAITAEYFRGNTPADEINTLLDRLATAGHITATKRPPASGRGRPIEVYTARAPDTPTN